MNKYTVGFQRFSSGIRAGNDPVVDQILSFRELNKGWHYGSGGPASEKEIYSALLIVTALKTAGAKTVEAFPDADGGILVNGYFDEESIEVFCAREHIFTLFHEKNDETLLDEDGLTIDLVKNYLQRLEWRSLRSSDLFTLNTIVEKKSALLVSHSSPPMMGPQSSTPNVLSEHLATCVPILENSTNLGSPETPPFFSVSKQVHSRRIVI